MAGRRISVIDLREMIRRFRLKQPNTGIARDLGISRTTVVRYKKMAGERGWLEDGPLPSLETLQKAMREADATARPGPVSPLEAHRETVEKLRRQGAEMQAIFGILKRDFDWGGSYSSLRRFVRKMEPLEAEPVGESEMPPSAGGERLVDAVDQGYRGGEASWYDEGEAAGTV